MLLFWILAAIMVAAVLLLLTPTLLRNRPASDSSSGRTNIALYRERLAELDAQREQGEIEAQRYTALREDLEHRLLADVDEAQMLHTISNPTPRWMAVVVATAVPVCGLAVYFWLGEPRGLAPQARSLEVAADHEQAPDMEAMVDSLAAKLTNDPTNGDSWLLLARSQSSLNRFDASIVAYRRAHALLGDDPSLLVDWAQAEAELAGKRFPISAANRIDRALELDPDHEKALWLGGFAAVQYGRPDVARGRWERLLAQLPPGSQEASFISGLLAKVDGAAPAAQPESAEPLSTKPAVTATPDAVDGPRIVVTVSLAPDLGVALGDQEPVFIFARTPAAAAGPPVAVARTVVAALPTTVVLDSSSAMIPSRSLANVDQVLITARVARAGTVRRTSGDIEGVFGPVAVTDTSPVKIVISQIVP